MEKENILCIDIGGTSIKIGVVSDSLVLESTSIRNVFKGDGSLLLPGIKDTCDQYVNKYNIKKIGIGCPGDIENGVVVLATNLGWENFDLLQTFKQRYPDFDIVIDNDGNAACYAEMAYGNLKNVDSGLFVTIGRGIGGAIILNGKLFHGMHNRGAKFGHSVIHTNGRKCNCGRRGCFETYASVTGLIQTIKEQNLKCNKEEEKIDTERISGLMIAKYYKEGNNSIKEGVKKWNKDIAEGLLNLCHIFDPSIIVVAGGITESGLLNMEFIQKFLKRHRYGKCEVTLAKFKGKTGLVGASALVEKKN